MYYGRYKSQLTITKVPSENPVQIWKLTKSIFQYMVACENRFFQVFFFHFENVKYRYLCFSGHQESIALISLTLKVKNG